MTCLVFIFVKKCQISFSILFYLNLILIF